MIGTTARAYEARDEADGPLSDNRCACGRRAAGYDARRGEATCEVCARLRTDGSDLEADAQHYLDGAGDMLETAATKAESDWLRGAIEEVRVDVAKLQGFQTAAELRGDRDDGIDRGDGIQTDGGLDEPFAPPRGAKAHICSRTGSTVYCALTECPYCDGGER